MFAVNTDGTGFKTLHTFEAASYNRSGRTTNSDGAGPQSTLVLSGNTLYGTTWYGGSSGAGTVFAVNTDGTGFTNRHNFRDADGGFPSGSMIFVGNTLYGTTSGGGSSGNGTIFSISFSPQLTLPRAGANVISTWPTSFAGFDYTGYTLVAESQTNTAAPDFQPTKVPPNRERG